MGNKTKNKNKHSVHCLSLQQYLFNKHFPFLNGLFIRGGCILLMEDICQNLCLQHRQECSNTLGIGQVECIVICQEVEKPLVKQIFPKGYSWSCTYNHYAVLLTNQQDRTGKHTPVDEGIRILWGLENQIYKYRI